MTSMADKPSQTPVPAALRASSSRDLTSPGGFGSDVDVEIRLRSTEKIKLVVRRCGRTNAPHHLLVRIRETLISITSTTRDRIPPH
jgi:hypothetical protein